MANDWAGQAGAVTKLEITPETIEAMRVALVKSEALEYPGLATEGLIRELVDAALSKVSVDRDC